MIEDEADLQLMTKEEVLQGIIEDLRRTTTIKAEVVMMIENLVTMTRR